jgi:hypothetical protein
VLLFWLFAVASSWANACLIQPGQTHLHVSDPAAALEVQSPTVSSGHRGADASHPENAGAARSACLKFCGDGAQALVKPAPGIDLLDVPLAPPWAFSWTTRQAVASSARRWQALPARRPGLPARTRFSRLAL